MTKLILGSRWSQITISIAYAGIFCSLFEYVHSFLFARQQAFARLVLYPIWVAPLLRIMKPAGGAEDTFQGLFEAHEDAMIITALNDFPVALPSLPRQPRALPDIPVQLLLIWSKYLLPQMLFSRSCCSQVNLWWFNGLSACYALWNNLI